MRITSAKFGTYPGGGSLQPDIRPERRARSHGGSRITARHQSDVISAMNRTSARTARCGGKQRRVPHPLTPVTTS